MSIFLELEDELIVMNEALEKVTYYATTIRYPEYGSNADTGYGALFYTSIAIHHLTAQLKNAAK